MRPTRIAAGTQGVFWYKRHMIKEAKSEALHAADVDSRKTDSNGELLGTVLLLIPANSLF